MFTLHLFENYSKLVYLDEAYYEYRLSLQSMTHKLRFSNYTDNVFRFNLYYEAAKKYFDEEFESVALEIDHVFFRMLISTLIKPRACFEHKSEYCDIVNQIRATEIFQQKMTSSFSKQNVAYKIILKSIEKGRMNRLLFFRWLCGFVFKK